jgi:hypothetical protein
VSVQAGQFYDGDLAQLTLSGARVAITKQFSAEPSLTVSKATLPAGNFTNTLFRTRVDYAFTPLRFLSALVQYLERPHLQQQPPLPLGIPPRQRGVRCLHGRARHDHPGISGPPKPGVRGEGEPVVPVLTPRTGR